ncbi:MAG: hypothetical protein V2J24_22835 [Pseudomonadales bacterium]|jgi:hypothetical protein|nr:hypothetical protein [Pseudomonadales bacterium]
MSAIVVFLAATKFGVALAAGTREIVAARTARARGVTSSFENSSN